MFYCCKHKKERNGEAPTLPLTHTHASLHIHTYMHIHICPNSGNMFLFRLACLHLPNSTEINRIWNQLTFQHVLTCCSEKGTMPAPGIGLSFMLPQQPLGWANNTSHLNQSYDFEQHEEFQRQSVAWGHIQLEHYWCKAYIIHLLHKLHILYYIY